MHSVVDDRDDLSKDDCQRLAGILLYLSALSEAYMANTEHMQTSCDILNPTFLNSLASQILLPPAALQKVAEPKFRHIRTSSSDSNVCY